MHLALRIFTTEFLAILVMVAAFGASSATAGTFTLQGDNASITIETDTPNGARDWIVDGVNQLAQLSYFYRTGAGGPELSVDTLAIGLESPSDIDGDGFDDVLFVRYLGAGFELEIRYILTGGSIGSGASSLDEQITIRNVGSSALGFHLFQYNNYDLAGDDEDLSAKLTASNSAFQSDDDGTELSESVTPNPSHAQVDTFDNILAALTDGNATTLTDAGGPIGPGNLTYAFQWDFSIDAAGSVTLSKVRSLTGTAPCSDPCEERPCFSLIGCDPVEGCQYESVCDAPDACTDDDVCTLDSCDESADGCCVHEDIPCPPARECYTRDVCDAVTGCPEEVSVCDDPAFECPDGTECDPSAPGCCRPSLGDEGCTPGYWKLIYRDSSSAHHECNWTSPYDPDDLFEDTCADCDGDGVAETCFVDAFGDLTLIEVLDQTHVPGNRPQLRNLGFHTVAALLNAASAGVDYGQSVCEVFDGFNAAAATGSNTDLVAQKDIFGNFNESGCPLGNCRCSDGGDVCCPGCERADGSDVDRPCEAGERCGDREEGRSRGDVRKRRSSGQGAESFRTDHRRKR